MSRYIDADALKKIIMDMRNHAVPSPCLPYQTMLIPDRMVCDKIDAMPTVDAVPVPDGGIGELSKPILCKECIHRPKMPDNHVDGFDLEFPDHECPCQCEDGFYSWYPADDWFCANGERRSDEQ